MCAFRKSISTRSLQHQRQEHLPRLWHMVGARRSLQRDARCFIVLGCLVGLTLHQPLKAGWGEVGLCWLRRCEIGGCIVRV